MRILVIIACLQSLTLIANVFVSLTLKAYLHTTDFIV